MTTYQQLDRTIYERIRRVLVERGFLPDIKVLSASDYETELNTLRSANKCIEVLGVGSREARDKKQVHRIAILRKSGSRGTLGAYNIKSYEEVLDDQGEIVEFKEFKEPQGNRNVLYEIRTITVDTDKEREMFSAIQKALGYGGYVPIVDAVTLDDTPDKVELLMSAGDIDISTVDFMERLITYEFNDVWLDERIETSTEIVPITRITWDNKFPEGTPTDNEQNIEP